MFYKFVGVPCQAYVVATIKIALAAFLSLIEPQVVKLNKQEKKKLR